MPILIQKSKIFFIKKNLLKTFENNIFFPFIYFYVSIKKKQRGVI